MNQTAIPTKRELTEGLERLMPSVEKLVRAVATGRPYSYYRGDTEVRMAASVDFDDGIGNGEFVAKLHMYRGRPRLDLSIEHDREFAAPDGSGSGIRCFLNDYVAAVELDNNAERLPQPFVREVVAGVAAALSAVSRNNRVHPEPWFKVNVAPRDSAWSTLMRDIL